MIEIVSGLNQAGSTAGSIRPSPAIQQDRLRAFHHLHATILHLLGFDHTRLVVKHQGLDYRLTGVEGKVLENLIA